MTKKDKINYEKIREEFRFWLVRAVGGCEIQGGYIRGKKQNCGWPCGTCLIHLFKKIGLNPRKKEYQERNDEVDRLNEVWRAVLQIRDAKLK
jgi:hypothetical protein